MSIAKTDFLFFTRVKAHKVLVASSPDVFAFSQCKQNDAGFDGNEGLDENYFATLVTRFI